MSNIASHLPLNTSETVRDRGLVRKDHQSPMEHQMVTWPMTSRDPVKLVTSMCLEPNLSKTAGDAI